MYQILLVEDDKALAMGIEFTLKEKGYKVLIAETLEEGKNSYDKESIDLILLDINLPDGSGYDLCRYIRTSSDVPIVFLTALDEEVNIVLGLDIGGDDYITKPIKPRALISRIKAFFRRESKRTKEADTISAGGLVIDRSSYTVTVDGQKINLPKKEFELLYFLIRNPGKVFSRDELLHNIWGTDVYVLARTVDVHVRKVREKIGNGHILTVKGVGYKFEQSS